MTFFDDAILLTTAYLIHDSMGIEIPVDNGKINGEALEKDIKRARAAGTA